MRLSADTRLRTRLILVVALPILALMGFSLSSVAEKYREASHMRNAERAVSLWIRASAAVHEAQKERGLSSGFLGAKGEKFGPELEQQRALTDKKVEEFQSVLKALQASAASKTVTERLAGLAPLRSSVSAQQIAPKDSFYAYTQLIESLIELVAGTIQRDAPPSLERAAQSYLMFVNGKEQAGRERATLNQVLAADRFEPETLRRFTSIVATQENYFGIFRSLTDEPSKAHYLSALESDSAKQAAKMRASAFEKASDGGFGIAPSEWFATMTRKIDDLKSVEDAMAGRLLARAQQLRDEASLTLAAHLALALLVFAVPSWLGYRTIRVVTGQLGGEPAEAVAVAARIAEGDLSTDIHTAASDETSLLATMQRMQERLRDMIRELLADASELATSAGSLAAVSHQIASGSRAQSAAAGSMAADVEEMSASIAQVSDNTSDAQNLAQQSRDLSSRGGAIIQRTVNEMNAIAGSIREASSAVAALEAHSGEISSIVSVIREVAEQTNLLALNAAIEAARAGEQGRGFAVVADEVRKLAERTTLSTQQIAETIAKIQEGTRAAMNGMEAGVARVAEGVEFASQAGGAIEEIQHSAHATADRVSEIAAAIQQQGVASADIASEVEKVAHMSDENCAATAGAAETSRSLQEMATGLQALVSRFKV